MIRWIDNIVMIISKNLGRGKIESVILLDTFYLII